MAICLVYETFQALERGKNPGEGREWQKVGVESVEEDWKEEVGEAQKNKGGVRSPFYRANLIACACRYRLSDLVGMLPCSCLHLFSKRLAIMFLRSKILDSGSYPRMIEAPLTTSLITGALKQMLRLSFFGRWAAPAWSGLACAC